MQGRASFTSFLFPLLIPTLAFFVAYFLFPSFSKEFFGVSVKGNSLETVQYSKETKALDSQKTIESDNAKMIEDVVFIPKEEAKPTETTTPSDVKTIKNPEFNKRGK